MHASECIAAVYVAHDVNAELNVLPLAHTSSALVPDDLGYIQQLPSHTLCSPDASGTEWC